MAFLASLQDPVKKLVSVVINGTLRIRASARNLMDERKIGYRIMLAAATDAGILC